MCEMRRYGASSRPSRTQTYGEGGEERTTSPKGVTTSRRDSLPFLDSRY